MIVISGCLKKADCAYKNENKVAPVAEEQALLNYLTANNITATKHGNNMYYEVVTPGAGAVAGLCSDVHIKYEGRLTNGSLFDSSTNRTFQLGRLIEGWKVGLPLIKPGGRILLYIPPSLGYGAADIKDNRGVVVIPANSIIVFDVSLLDVR